MENKQLTIKEYLSKLETEFKTSEIVQTTKKHIVDKIWAGFMLTGLKNKDVFKCDRLSIIDSLLKCSQFELIPNGTGQCCLLPYKNGDVSNLQFQPEYKGIIEIAYRTGIVKSINSSTVYENDAFDFDEGSNPFVKHKKTLGERGQLIGVYVVINLQDSQIIQVMAKKEIDSVMNKTKQVITAKKYNNGKDEKSIWFNYYDEQAKKTVIKRALKLAPKSEQLNQLIQLDNSLEADFVNIPDDSKAMKIMSSFGLNKLPEPTKQEVIEPVENEKVIAEIEMDDVPDDFYDLANDPNFLNEQPKRGK